MANVRVAKAFVEVAADLERLEDDLKKVRRKAEQAGDDAGEKFDRGFRGRLNRLGGRLKSFFTSARGLATAAFVGLAAKAGKELFEIGSQIEQIESQFRILQGEQAEATEAWIEGFRRMAGVTTAETKTLLNSTTAIVQGVGASREEAALFAIQAAELAGDLAAFKDLETADVLDRINRALLGENESLKTIGVGIDANLVKQRALIDTGKTREDQLTRLEKAQAALAVIQEKSAFAAGNLADTQDEVAVRTKNVAATFREIRDEMARQLLPQFAKLVELVDENRDEMTDFSAVTIGALTALGRTAGNAIAVVGDTIALIVSSVIRGVGEVINFGIRGLQKLSDLSKSTRLIPDFDAPELLDLSRATETQALALSNLGKNLGDIGDAWVDFRDTVREVKADEDEATASTMTLEEALAAAGATAGRTAADMTELRERVQELRDDASELTDILAEPPDALDRLRNDLERVGLSLVDVIPLAERMGLSLEEFAEQTHGAADELNLELIPAEEAAAAEQRALNNLLDAYHASLERGASARAKFVTDLLKIASGAVEVAGAFGLELGGGAVGGLLNIGEGIGRIVTGDVVGGVIEGLKGVGSLIGGIFGGGPSQADLFREQFRDDFIALRDDADRLLDIAKNLSSITAPISDLFEAVGDVGKKLGRGEAREVNQELDRLGLNIGDLQVAALSAGVDISELMRVLQTGEGDRELAAAQFDALNRVVQLLPQSAAQAAIALERMRASLDDIDSFAEVFDIVDPAELFVLKLEPLLELIRGTKLEAIFGNIFEQFDTVPELMSDAGQAAAETFLRRFFSDQSIFDPSLEPIVTELDRLLDQIRRDQSSSAGGGVPAPRVPRITRPATGAGSEVAPISRSIATEVQFEEQLAVARTTLVEIQGVRSELVIANGFLARMASRAGGSTVGEELARQARDVERRTGGGIQLP